MRIFLILALAFASATSGVVEYERCGGVATFIQLRVHGCEGPTCTMVPGNPYVCEGDLIPGSVSEALRLKITFHYLGFPINIVDTVLPDSVVEPGVMYTANFTITPNDLLQGQGTFPATADLLDNQTGLLHICVRFQVSIEASTAPTTPRTTTSTTPSTTTTPFPPAKCPEAGILRIAHEEWCDTSYLCLNGERWDDLFHCPEGLYFDSTVGECNYESQVDCGDLVTSSTPPELTTTPPELFECPPTGVIQFPYIGNCTLYRLCIEGDETIYSCPVGTIYDTEEGKCLSEGICTVEWIYSLF